MILKMMKASMTVMSRIFTVVSKMKSTMMTRVLIIMVWIHFFPHIFCCIIGYLTPFSKNKEKTKTKITKGSLLLIINSNISLLKRNFTIKINWSLFSKESFSVRVRINSPLLLYCWDAYYHCISCMNTFSHRHKVD